MLKFEGEIGDNYTGASVGGFEISDSTYLVVGNHKNETDTYNVFVSVTNKSNLKDTKLVYLTKYTDKLASAPMLVKVSNERFLVLWEARDAQKSFNLDEVFYVWIDQDGNKIGEIQSVDGRLSDCQPIIANGQVTWYYTKGTTPIMSAIPSDGSKPVNNVLAGDTYDIGKLTYCVLKNTKDTKTVSVVKAVDTEATKITVPDEVKIHDETYKVTEIEADAFSFCVLLKSLTIGSNVEKIGFDMTSYWNNDITKVVIKSKVLTKVGDNSFQGMHQGIIKVPKSKLAKYKKLLAYKGQDYLVEMIGY